MSSAENISSTFTVSRLEPAGENNDTTSVLVKLAASVKSSVPPKPSVFHVATKSTPRVSVSAPFKKNCPTPAPALFSAASRLVDNPLPKRSLITIRSSISIE